MSGLGAGQPLRSFVRPLRENLYFLRSRRLLREQRNAWKTAFADAADIDEEQAIAPGRGLAKLIDGLEALTPPARLRDSHQQFLTANPALLDEIRAYHQAVQDQPAAAESCYQRVKQAETELDRAETALFFG